MPFHDPRKPKEGLDVSKLRGDDHLTTWSQSNKGKQMGLYVETVPGTFNFMQGRKIVENFPGIRKKLK